MDYRQINEALVAVVERRNQFADTQDATKKSAMAKELKASEDAFMEEYGSALREVMLDIQDEYFPDSEMQPMMSYVAKRYEVAGKNEWGDNYQTHCQMGASVEIDDFPGKSTHIVLMPNPLRVVLHIDEYTSHQIWTAQKPTYVS